METLIPVINKLQDVFNTIGAKAIELPQIVVVGTQSSGKSSVIESLVGRSFLPRGTGIVTRRPLVLQLVYTPKEDREHRSTENGTLDVDEWGVFLHDKGTIYTDFDAIRREIEKETNRLAGENRGICPEQINLKIYSSSVVNLTLIDLPGITKVPVGDQPENIETQVKNLVMEYICNPNSIILAVVTANADMATSESLKLSKDVDPHGDRTLAVVTKIDIMDEGTDAIDILRGDVIPVKLGIIGVVNRCQKDIRNNKSIQKALEDETAFFQRKYPALAAQNGTPYLAQALNHLLMHHIRNSLPGLKAKVNSLISKYGNLLNSYGEEIVDKGDALLKIITNFATSYCAIIEGNEIDRFDDVYGGAKLAYIFYEIFRKALDSIEPLAGLTRMGILRTIMNATGLRPSLLVPEVAFGVLVKKEIMRLKQPSLNCVELIHKEIERIGEHYRKEVQEMQRFPKLYEKIMNVVVKLIQKRLPTTNYMVENLIHIQLSLINTRHPDFQKDMASVFLLIKNSSQQKGLNLYSEGILPNEKELSNQQQWGHDVTKKFVESYFSIVRKSIEDNVPKTIMYFLIDYVKDNLQNELIKHLYKRKLYETLITEDKHFVVMRKEAADMLQALNEADRIISEVRETYV